MIARLLLALLLAAWTTPSALAAGCCHEGATIHHALPEQPAAPERLMPAHSCLGCIPPGDWLKQRIAAPMTPRAIVPAVRIAPLALSTSWPPATPPPREA